MAEDEALIRMDQEMLTEEGYEVVGQAGHRRGRPHLGQPIGPEVVLLDVRMPVMDGIPAQRRRFLP